MTAHLPPDLTQVVLVPLCLAGLRVIGVIVTSLCGTAVALVCVRKSSPENLPRVLAAAALYFGALAALMHPPRPRSTGPEPGAESATPSDEKARTTR